MKIRNAIIYPTLLIGGVLVGNISDSSTKRTFKPINNVAIDTLKQNKSSKNILPISYYLYKLEQALFRMVTKKAIKR